MIDKKMVVWAVEQEITIADMELLGFPSRLRDKLDARGILTLEQLLNYTEKDLRNIPGVGKGYIKCIYTILANLSKLKDILESEEESEYVYDAIYTKARCTAF